MSKIAGNCPSPFTCFHRKRKIFLPIVPSLMIQRTGLFRLTRRLHLCSDELHHFGERLRIIDGKIRKDLPIDLDRLFIERGDQFRIRCAVSPGSGIDSCNPDSPKETLLGSSMPVSMRERLLDVMFGHSVDFTSSAPVAFRFPEEFFSAPVRGDFVL
jgi:hypothetical protein